MENKLNLIEKPKSEESQQQIHLKHKPRYDALDGLRGIGSIIVVLFHLFMPYRKDKVPYIINHGYLAVDFFFLLSGFVTAYAYDDRWGKMTLWDFYKRRIIRLHPLVVLSTVISASNYFYYQGQYFPLVGKASSWKIIVCIILSLFMIPSPKSLNITGHVLTYPFNGPVWTLFFEYIANILYSLIFRRLHTSILCIMAFISALLTMLLCFNLDLFKVLQQRTIEIHRVNGGYNLDSTQLFIGFTRLFYPFLMGQILARFNYTIKIKGGFWISYIALTALLCCPSVGGYQSIYNGIYEFVVIIFLFPLILLIGAGGSSMMDSTSSSINKFIGDLSYPMYMTHFVLINFRNAWSFDHPNAPLFQKIYTFIGTGILIFLLAYASNKLYNEPVVKYLSEKFLVKKKPIKDIEESIVKMDEKITDDETVSKVENSKDLEAHNAF